MLQEPRCDHMTVRMHLNSGFNDNEGHVYR